MDDSDVDDIHLDIFRELDTDLIEIFRRGQQGSLFSGLPAGQHNQRLDTLNEYIIARTDQLSSRRHHERERDLYSRSLFYFVWIFGLLPLPPLRLHSIWRRYKPTNLKTFIIKLITRILMLCVKVIRFISFIIASSAYLHGILRNLLIFSNFLTFSENFMRDVLTYIIKDSQDILDRHIQVKKHGGDLFYFTNYNDYSLLDTIKNVLINWLAKCISSDCLFYKQEDHPVDIECSISTNSLIFKFSDVLVAFFPSFSNERMTFYLKSSTVMIFVLYALIGDLVCMNIMVFFFYNIGKRVVGYKSVFGNLGAIVYHTLFSEVC
ncbi:uncharacterized protein RJT21DRAFT_34212 [Scheffersomyces amazonensis]|uniref:uncharacterized protein n=1 Tax=Scheffersomyces amazonensis TaxID=1078765 RepID=UPI00315DF435